MPALATVPRRDFVPDAARPAPLVRTVAAIGPEELAGLTRLARNLANSRDDADDLLQEAFLRALGSNAHFEGAANLSAWMHTVMYRLAIDCSRRTKRRKWESAHLDCLPAPDSDREFDGELPPWTGLGIGDVRAAANQLPAALRETFCLFAFERKSYEDIAVLCRIPVRTVGTRLCRARRKLRSILQDNRTVPFCPPQESLVPLQKESRA